jgi:hypothetical protein
MPYFSLQCELAYYNISEGFQLPMYGVKIQIPKTGASEKFYQSMEGKFNEKGRRKKFHTLNNFSKVPFYKGICNL